MNCRKDQRLKIKMTVTYNYDFDDNLLLVKENNKTYKIELGERLLQSFIIQFYTPVFKYK